MGMSRHAVKDMSKKLTDDQLREKIFGNEEGRTRFRVTPKTSELLQKLVFRLGGRWSGTTDRNVGYLSRSVISICSGGGVACSDSFEYGDKSNEALKEILELAGCNKLSGVKGYEEHLYRNTEYTNKPIYDSATVRAILYDNPALHDYDLTKGINKVRIPPLEGDWGFIGDTDSQLARNNLNTKEENNMQHTQRRTVEVNLFDDDKGLPVEMALVAGFEDVVTEDDDATTIREVLMTQDINKALEDHNVLRSEQVNEEILARTGNEVMLRPVKLKDLRWEVKG